MSTATITLTKNLQALLPAVNAPFAKTTVTLTDSAGVIQTADLTGAETPPWVAVFPNVAAVAGATGTVTAQDLDTAGVAIGALVSVQFTEIGTPVTFPATTAIAVTIA